jgi:TRAP-type C4-dicarboxylate transport system substrate-binding protein
MMSSFLRVSALALAVATVAAPAHAQFEARSLRVSSGVAKGHPIR